jgi:hypothetical protein
MTVLDEGLVAYLKAHAGLSALISTRVYLAPMPQGATLPCLTLQRIDTPRTLTHDTSGATGTLARPRFQFDAWALTYASTRAITDQVRAALNGHTGTTGTGVTIRAALVQDERPDYDPLTALFRCQSDYFIWHEE